MAVVGGSGAETESLEKRTMGPSWYRVLQNEFKQPYFLKVRPRPPHALRLFFSVLRFNA